MESTFAFQNTSASAITCADRHLSPCLQEVGGQSQRLSSHDTERNWALQAGRGNSERRNFFFLMALAKELHFSHYFEQSNQKQPKLWTEKPLNHHIFQLSPTIFQAFCRINRRQKFARNTPTREGLLNYPSSFLLSWLNKAIKGIFIHADHSDQMYN